LHWRHSGMHMSCSYLAPLTTWQQWMHKSMVQCCGNWKKQSEWRKDWALISSLLEFNKLYITTANVSIALITMWRNWEFVHYTFFSWLSMLK
jgi:hypothetical protein